MLPGAYTHSPPDRCSIQGAVPVGWGLRTLSEWRVAAEPEAVVGEQLRVGEQAELSR